MKWGILLLICCSLNIFADECGEERVVLQQFFSTPFGKSSRTIDIKEAERITQEIKSYQSKNPGEDLIKVEVLSCTSTVPLPPLSKTDIRSDEHLDLALQRALMVKKELNKIKISSQVSHQQCGPEFNKEDLNLRFRTKESGELYREAINYVKATPQLMELYKTQALINSFEEALKIYPNPFQLKYQPFQGYHLTIHSRKRCLGNKVPSANHQIKSTKKE
jgi:hypothetical protein